MAVPDSIRTEIEQSVDVSIRGTTPVGGGCISSTSRIETDKGPFFLKWGGVEDAELFEAESVGLKELRGSNSPVLVPEVLGSGKSNDKISAFLLLQWIETGTRGRHFWTDFGRELAALHRFEADAYGFRLPNFIGRLPQQNTWHDTWPDFFRQERLVPQIEMARSGGRWNRTLDLQSEKLLQRLDELLPRKPEKSVLHGDLWGGNVMTSEEGRAVLIDPAVYFGHREADLAMTELFGSFDRSFYGAYREAWPLEPGYEDRKQVYNLYHLINHLNHFGTGYVTSVASILKHLGG